MQRLTIPMLLLASLFAFGSARADDDANGATSKLHLEPYVFEAADGTRIDAERGSFSVP